MNEEWKYIEGYEGLYHINTISYSKQYARLDILPPLKRVGFLDASV